MLASTNPPYGAPELIGAAARTFSEHPARRRRLSCYWYKIRRCAQKAKNAASTVHVIGQLRVRKNAV